MANIAPQPRFRAFDANGDPLAGGKLFTYEAGTTTPKDTYTTAEGDVANANPVILDADGYADVWLGDGGYKFVLKTSEDATLWTVDDIGGSSSTAFGGDVNTISTNTVINSVYANSVILASGTISLSLGAAADLGEGFYFSVKNTSSGVITIDPDGSETINGAATLALAENESALIITNGTAWFSLFLYQGFAKVASANTFTAANTFNATVTMGAAFNASKGADIASAATTNIATATGNYVDITGTTTITALGTAQAGTERVLQFDGILTLTHNATSLILPTGANITTAAGDTARFVSEGSGNWRCVAYTRANGKALARTSDLVLHIQDQKTANTAGGTFTSGAWQTRTLNTEVTDTIGSTLSSNQFTLPAGTYDIDAIAPAFTVGLHKAKLYNVTDAADTLQGTSASAQASSSVFSYSVVRGRFTIADTKTFEIRHQCQTTRATDGFGIQSNFSVIEIYTDVKITKIDS